MPADQLSNRRPIAAHKTVLLKQVEAQREARGDDRRRLTTV